MPFHHVEILQSPFGPKYSIVPTQHFSTINVDQFPVPRNINQIAQLHKHNNQTHLHITTINKTHPSLYFSAISAFLLQELLKYSICSLTMPSSSLFSASLSTPFPSRTQTNVAIKYALPIKPSAAKSLSMGSLSLDALLNAHRFKPFKIARNHWPPLQHLRLFPPLDLSAETLSSALLARSAALMRFTTVPTLTRSANSAPGKWQIDDFLHVHRANTSTERNDLPVIDMERNAPG